VPNDSKRRASIRPESEPKERRGIILVVELPARNDPFFARNNVMQRKKTFSPSVASLRQEAMFMARDMSPKRKKRTSESEPMPEADYEKQTTRPLAGCYMKEITRLLSKQKKQNLKSSQILKAVTDLSSLYHVMMSVCVCENPCLRGAGPR
jgi:hypothetical protein